MDTEPWKRSEAKCHGKGILFQSSNGYRAVEAKCHGKGILVNGILGRGTDETAYFNKGYNQIASQKWM